MAAVSALSVCDCLCRGQEKVGEEPVMLEKVMVRVGYDTCMRIVEERGGMSRG